MINEKSFRVKKNNEPYSNCYCTKPKLIENYDLAIADKNQIWECHHRMENIFSRETLIAIGWYYDCEPNELIFLTPEEHMSLHHKDKILSEETKRKISDAHKNLSEEAKLHMSNAHKGQTAWNKGKKTSEEQKRKMSAAKKGKHWKLVDGKRFWY